MTKNIFVACFLFFLIHAVQAQHQYVEPFIGTDNNGNVLPGTCLPFSFMRLGPDVPVPHPTSGYSSDKPIKGFSHTHVSGTGGNGQYGNISAMPVTGKISLKGFESDKSEEFSSAGYYKVRLTRYNILVELTQTEKTGLHRYTFPETNDAHILLDISSMIKKNGSNGFMHNIRTEAHVIGNNAIEGFGEYAGGWGNADPNKIYFHAELNKPVREFQTWNHDTVLNEHGNVLTGKDGGFVLSFSTRKNEQVLLKVAISPLSVEAARKNLEREMPGWNFDQIKAQAGQKWDNYLQRIKVEGGDNELKRIFYTALYHVFVMPSEITGQNPRWKSDGPAFWDFYTLWDTFRASNPLLGLIAPEKEREIIRSLLDIYRHDGWLPDAWIVGHYAGKQGGTNADVVIADAIVKDLGGFDYKEAYQAIKKDADVPSPKPWIYGRHKEYIEDGFCPSTVNCGTSYTLEYAYNDFCISQVAEKLGIQEDSKKYKLKSLNCYKLFYPEKGFFWSKSKDGVWVEGFRPDYIRAHQQSGYFYEGTPYQYSFYVPHDVGGLVKRHGGSENFLAFLDTLFDKGYYTHNNQPDIHVPYLYDYIGRPDRTAERVRKIMKEGFTSSRAGLPGNDDAGCMSAWYVFGALGFYPVPGQDIYLIGSPVFKKSSILLENQKNLVIIAKQASDRNIYVQSIKLNGKPLENTWFRHQDIVNGGTIEFEMGPTPGKWGTHSASPPSLSDKTF